MRIWEAVFWFLLGAISYFGLKALDLYPTSLAEHAILILAMLFVTEIISRLIEKKWGHLRKKEVKDEI